MVAKSLRSCLGFPLANSQLEFVFWFGSRMFVYFADVLFSGQLDDNIQLGRSTSYLSDANIKAGSMRSRSLKLPVSSSHADCLADLDSHGLWKWHWADGFLFYISI